MPKPCLSSPTTPTRPSSSRGAGGARGYPKNSPSVPKTRGKRKDTSRGAGGAWSRDQPPTRTHFYGKDRKYGRSRDFTRRADLNKGAKADLTTPDKRVSRNLVRLFQTLSPSLDSKDFLLSDVWNFYDNPYGHECRLKVHGEEIEAFFVPYLSGLQLFAAPAPAPAPAPTVSPFSAPLASTPASATASTPFFEYFETARPNKRLPIGDQIAALSALCPLLESGHCSAIDTTKSWFSISWYPILCDRYTQKELIGSFLTYHTFEVAGACPLSLGRSQFAAEHSPYDSSPYHNRYLPNPFSLHNLASANQLLDAEVKARDSDSDNSSSSVLSSPSSASVGSISSSGGSSGGAEEGGDNKPADKCRACGSDVCSSVSPGFGLEDPEDTLFHSAAAYGGGGGGGGGSKVFLNMVGYVCDRVAKSTWFDFRDERNVSPVSKQQQQQQQQPHHWRRVTHVDLVPALVDKALGHADFLHMAQFSEFMQQVPRARLVN